VSTDAPAASRATPFGYICRRCSLCCRHKGIQLNPYEVARLARAMGESTAQFRAAWTIDGRGTTLRQKDDGTCVFLGPQGCEVHADRPLVCRLYPLARHVQSDGSESFTTLEGHPQSAGEFTDDGTIADYLAAQGAKPFMDAADGYFRWLCTAHERLGLTLDALSSGRGGDPENADLLDMDGMIAAHCAATGEAEPVNLDDRLQVHLQLLHDAINMMENGHVKGGSEVCDASA
jgi:Fe-S-cluster containining protein